MDVTSHVTGTEKTGNVLTKVGLVGAAGRCVGARTRVAVGRAASSWRWGATAGETPPAGRPSFHFCLVGFPARQQVLLVLAAVVAEASVDVGRRGNLKIDFFDNQ